MNFQAKRIVRRSFDHRPSLAELWDMTVDALYDRKQYAQELAELLRQYGLKPQGRLLDTCAGSGFPALDLIELGYEVVSMDASPDMAQAYAQNAQARHLTSRCRLAIWSDMRRSFKKQSFDVLICRGSSIIQASGGWNGTAVDHGHAHEALTDTLKTYHAMLKPNGCLFIDKYRDTTDPIREHIGELEIQGTCQNLFFRAEVDPSTQTRTAWLSCVGQDGVEYFTPNYSPYLTEHELEGCMLAAGFKTIQPVELLVEPHLACWIAR